MEKEYEQVKEKIEKYNQEQLLVCYDKLSKQNQEKLLKQILSIDFELMDKLFKMTKQEINMEKSKIEPIQYVDKEKINAEDYKKLEDKGIEVIKSGKLAVVTMAGGQGTRLRT